MPSGRGRTTEISVHTASCRPALKRRLQPRMPWNWRTCKASRKARAEMRCVGCNGNGVSQSCAQSADASQVAQTRCSLLRLLRIDRALGSLAYASPLSASRRLRPPPVDQPEDEIDQRSAVIGAMRDGGRAVALWNLGWSVMVVALGRVALASERHDTAPATGSAQCCKAQSPEKSGRCGVRATSAAAARTGPAVPPRLHSAAAWLTLAACP